MDVLFVTPLYTPHIGGATAFVAAMARRLVANGHSATVLTTSARSADQLWRSVAGSTLLPPSEILTGVRVERLALGYAHPVPYAFAVLRRAGHALGRTGLPVGIQRALLTLLGRWMPRLQGLGPTLEGLAAHADLVHAVESSWDGLFTAAAGAAMSANKPFVATPLMHLGSAAVRSHFQMAHQAEAYRRAAAVLALSEAEATEYARLGVAQEKVHHLSMGIDLPPADLLAPGVSPGFRQAHGITGPLVAFLGANTYDKGAFTLARAVAALNRAGLEVHAAFAGPHSEGLQSLMETELRGPGQRLHVLGMVDEATKHALLAACDVLALPSQVDAFGIVLLEAWVHGKPVIGASAGGIPELVREGESGLLVPFGSVDSLRQVIARLIADPALGQRLGERGREEVLRLYTWDQTYAKLEAIYAGALASRNH